GAPPLGVGHRRPRPGPHEPRLRPPRTGRRGDTDRRGRRGMTVSNPFLDLPGAVEAETPDAGVPAHYGSPLREQRALDDGRAIVDLSHRGVLTVTGPDRLGWLDSLSSQLLRGLRPGESAETLLLGPSGRVEHA